MVNDRENYLVFLLTLSMFIDSDIDIEQSFLKVVGQLALEGIVALILGSLFYFLITKHAYKWLVEKIHNFK